ncbi:MAG: U32 family peptidase [Treponema sp.]|nr:U32 family peptidase [Candidatus Treponema merdequi]
MAELLAPAGNIESLDAAIGEGADAVYLGLKSFNARLRTTNFAWNQFEAAVNSLHRQNKKIYVTVNTVSEERDLERLYRFLSYLNKIGPDGLIVQDYAVIRMCQEFFPDLVLHASTQMNVASAAGVNLLSKEGFKRVVVARELGLEEIKAIKAKTNTELEVFVHGALCVSESGLCLFSSFLGGKSANRGMCTQACRRFYTAEVPGGIDQGYYFSPCDLQLIDKIPDLMEAGVESFKIEGRMKSAEYVGSVVSAYRYLMDHYTENKKEAVAAAKRMLSTDFARAKTSYWYNFKTLDEGVEGAGSQILNPKQAGGTGIYLGKIDKTKPGPQDFKMVTLAGGSYDPDPGDSIRLHKKDDTGRESHKVRFLDTDEKGNRWIDVPSNFTSGDSVYLLQTKAMSKRYAHVLPNDLSKYFRQPGDEQLPILDLTPVAKNELSYFPEGVYIQVSSIEDIFIVQSGHPVRVIIELNKTTIADLTKQKTVIPLSKKQLILSLDPFCAAANEDELVSIIDTLIELGYKTFIANNVAHISMLKGKGVNIIAGPYLYTFNRWAVSWLENQDIGAFVSPYENSRHNLEDVYDMQFRQRVLVPVFAYPALFRIRFKLPKEYDFTFFSDKENVGFKVNSTPDGSFVMPETPFSIIDKVDFLGGIGFKRILIDFSKTKVQKTHFKQVYQALLKKQFLPETSRFNWKDGFYSPEKLENFKAADERRAMKNSGSKDGRKGNYSGKGRGKSFTSDDGGRGKGNGYSKGRNRKR